MEMKVQLVPGSPWRADPLFLLFVLTPKICRNSSHLSGKRFRTAMAVSG